MAVYIEINPNKRFGQPYIRGTRITVADILSLLATGLTNEEIKRDFPELTLAHIKAALFFAANRESSLRIALTNNYT